jgi:hypothetical protein
MSGIWLVLLILSTIVSIYLQQTHVNRNYPSSWRWRSLVFGVYFATGAIGAMTFLAQEFDGFHLLIFVLMAGIALGLFFTFLFPLNMQNITPKRKE